MNKNIPDMLPIEELVEVMSSPLDERRNLFIGGLVNHDLGVLTLVKGDLQHILVPLSFFQPSATTEPDFFDFVVGDYGHTLRFGEYEATSDIVLQWINTNRRAHPIMTVRVCMRCGEAYPLRNEMSTCGRLTKRWWSFGFPIKCGCGIFRLCEKVIQ